MEILTASKCSYCGKLYTQVQTCLRHESRCYSNRLTRSCISCSFLQKIEYKKMNGKSETLPTCIKRLGIAKKLRIRCGSHHWKEFPESTALVKEAFKAFSVSPLCRFYGKKYSWWRIVKQYVFAYYKY